MTKILILADIEGSTACLKREDAQLFNDGWVDACVGLTRDLNEICSSLLQSGATHIRIKDFHRTGYNIFKELLIDGVELDQGYKSGPVIGIGDVRGYDLLMMVGLHAASGTPGFLPHTLTSKLSEIEVNEHPLCEAELFASSVADYGLRPAFFSGCQEACSQAAWVIPGLFICEVEKPLSKPAVEIRKKLAAIAAEALTTFKRSPDRLPLPHRPAGPFDARITMRDGAEVAEKMRKRWKLKGSSDIIEFSAPDMNALYWQLIRIAYLTPAICRSLEFSLRAANLVGKIAHLWARRRLNKLKINLRDR